MTPGGRLEAEVLAAPKPVLRGPARGPGRGLELDPIPIECASRIGTSTCQDLSLPEISNGYGGGGFANCNRSLLQALRH
jgi:hypothetical protein